jgi:hypothetical protein
VLETIETLAPGLYAMLIDEEKGADGKVAYKVTFVEQRLEEVVHRFNRFRREDEKPFEAVVELSEFNQHLYELFAQPYVQWASNETTAHLLREFHPLRFQRWAFSDLNPWLAWLRPTANAVRANRQHPGDIEPWRKAEQRGSEVISASLDHYRALRDAAAETLFFAIYTHPWLAHFGDRHRTREAAASVSTDPRELPFVKEALASIQQGGYAEAVARTAFLLLARKGEPLPFALLATARAVVDSYAEYLPSLPSDRWRRIRGEQELIATYEPQQAIATLPALLAKPEDRERLLALMDRLLADERLQRVTPTAQQWEALQRIRVVLGAPPAARSVESLERAPS